MALREYRTEAAIAADEADAAHGDAPVYWVCLALLLATAALALRLISLW